MNGLPKRFSYRHGVTLIELLVSLSIVAVMAAVIVAAVNGGIMVWERTSIFDRGRLEAMLCLESMEKDLRNTFPFYGIRFEGDAVGLKFPGIVADAGNEMNAAGIREIEYRFASRERVIERRMRRYPFDGLKTEVFENVIENVKSAKITYADVAGERNEPPVWKDLWSGSRRHPAGVRFELEIQESGRTLTITRMIYLPRPVRQENADDPESVM